MRGRQNVQSSKVQFLVLHDIAALMRPININALLVRLGAKPEVVKPLGSSAWLYLLLTFSWEFSIGKKVVIDPQTC